MLVSSVGVAAIVMAAVGIWRLTGGEVSTDSPGGAAGWDRIALVDRTTGAVTIVDGDGDVTAEVDGAGRTLDVHAHRDQLAVVGATEISLTDTAGSTPVVVPIERGSVVDPYTADDAFHLVVGDADGGDVEIVDGGSGNVIDVGEMTGQSAPLIFPATVRASPDGRRFALADAASFRTILVTVDDTQPRYFPDQPIALGDDSIATSQVIDREADITLSDFERTTLAATTIDIPVGATIIDERLLLVSGSGVLSELGDGDEEARQVATIAVPAGDTVRSMAPTFDGERLVATGATFQTIVDLDGEVVYTVTFPTALDTLAPDPEWDCLPIGGQGGFVSLVSLETGEQLADLTGLELSGTASDGCTVIGERNDTTEVVGADGTVSLGPARLAVLGPDGRTVVRRTTDGTTELLRIDRSDDELRIADAVVIDDVAPPNLAVAFLGD